MRVTRDLKRGIAIGIKGAAMYGKEPYTKKRKRRKSRRPKH